MEVTGLTIGRGLQWIRSIKPGADASANGHNGSNGHHPLATLPEGEIASATNGAKPKTRRTRKNGKRAAAAVVDAPATLTNREMVIADQILKEIEGRLQFLDSIGLDYVTMNRTARTLSGGEAQRVRLATQIGSGLTGVLYVCDEPTVGLHPHDDHRLIGTLTRLRDMGNTVIVVEHDDAMMRAADHIVDLGPGAGEHGGHIVATGGRVRSDGQRSVADRRVPQRAQAHPHAGGSPAGQR